MSVSRNKLKRVNALRVECKLDPLEKLPAALGNFCEHCVSDLSDDELDIEYCNTCNRRVDVRMPDEEWERQVKGRP